MEPRLLTVFILELQTGNTKVSQFDEAPQIFFSAPLLLFDFIVLTLLL